MKRPFEKFENPAALWLPLIMCSNWLFEVPNWRKIMVKILVAGDVKGSLAQLLAKVAQYHK